MKASKLFVSMAAAATLVGTIGLSYAQTTYGTTNATTTDTTKSTDTAKSPDATKSTDTANKDSILDNSTGALGQSDAAKKPMRVARSDRN